MKIRKKTAIVASFTLGSLLFVGTAFAEVTSKNGYIQLKDAVKYTADSCATKFKNYTMEDTLVIKVGDKVIHSESSTQKYDMASGSRESIDGDQQGTKGYYYTDKKTSISHNIADDTYYVNEYTNDNNIKLFSNPFDEKYAVDAEKIVDAVVGNLKDYVIVSENADGTKELSGSLSEAQIPTIVDAIISYSVKKDYGSNNQMADYKITKDIFVKDIVGNMTLDKNGLIQKILFTATISGKDDSDKVQNISLEMLANLSNINTTVVKKPDLTGKKVQTGAVNNDKVDQKYIGEYKTDIVLDKDGKLQKIGEKTLDITQITETNIVGSYKEEYKAGFETYAKAKKTFNFDAKVNTKNSNADFKATTPGGESYKGNIFISPHSNEVYFNMDNEHVSGNIINDSNFKRVFD